MLRSSVWRQWFRILLPLAALGLLLALAGATWIAFERSRPITLPAPSGPFAVGRAVFDWVDASRPEAFAPGPTARRELLVWVWYPAAPAPAAGLGPYLPQAWGRARAADMGLGALLSQQFETISGHAVENAPLAPLADRVPLLVFSTGYGRLPADYTTLLEDLASHGYLIAAIANPYSAPVVVFPEGRAIYRLPAAAIAEDSAEAAQVDAARLATLWAQDIHFTIDQMERLNADPVGPFAGRLDLARIGVFGHSLGGAASAEVCRTDRRCRAVVDLDGTLYGQVTQQGMPVPFLIVSSEPPSPRAAAEDNRSFAASLVRGAAEISVQGTRHMNFTDLAVAFSPLLKLTGMLGPIDGRRGLAITAVYTRSFFDRFLRDVDSPLLIGPSPAYPEVRLDGP